MQKQWKTIRNYGNDIESVKKNVKNLSRLEIVSWKIPRSLKKPRKVSTFYLSRPSSNFTATSVCVHESSAAISSNGRNEGETQWRGKEQIKILKCARGEKMVKSLVCERVSLRGQIPTFILGNYHDSLTFTIYTCIYKCVHKNSCIYKLLKCIHM